MTTNEFPAGAPCWIELMTSDAGQARDFYAGLFGWTAGAASDEFGGYFMFMLDGVPIAGAMPAPAGAGLPDDWNVYLAADDARATVRTAAAHSGSVRVEPMDVADLGKSAVIDDCGGARIGVWQADTFAGCGALATPGAPAWFEVLTRDYDMTVAFYRDVFGWKTHAMSDSGDFRYTTSDEGDAARAGIMDASGVLRAGQPARWSVYFAVEDTDAAIDTVTNLGGTVTRTAEDTPFGRLAGAADPTGAPFNLIAR